jgi:YVTN family beta-propeller protein
MKTKSMRSSARSAVLVTALAAAVLAPPTAASATPVTHSGDSPVIAADGLHHSLGSSSQTVGTATWHQEHVAAPGGALARARFLLTGSGADAARMVAAPAAWARSGNQGTAYVTNAGSNTVTPIRTATDTAGTPIKVGSNPFGIAITPNGKTAYVTNLGSNTVTPIRTAANTAGAPIRVGSSPGGIAITP